MPKGVLIHSDQYSCYRDSSWRSRTVSLLTSGETWALLNGDLWLFALHRLLGCVRAYLDGEDGNLGTADDAFGDAAEQEAVNAAAAVCSHDDEITRVGAR